MKLKEIGVYPADKLDVIKNIIRDFEIKDNVDLEISFEIYEHQNRNNSKEKEKWVRLMREEDLGPLNDFWRYFLSRVYNCKFPNRNMVAEKHKKIYKWISEVPYRKLWVGIIRAGKFEWRNCYKNEIDWSDESLILKKDSFTAYYRRQFALVVNNKQ